MARSLEARIARLEAPHGNIARTAARTYHMLRACYQVLSRLDGDQMLSEAELRAMAQAGALSIPPPDFTRALEAIWREESSQ
jgi:hypothetical protein